MVTLVIDKLSLLILKIHRKKTQKNMRYGLGNPGPDL